ncbi:uncharacterized protein BDZ83DRAFT_635903, partial [Colletotrichum acutatum]
MPFLPSTPEPKTHSFSSSCTPTGTGEKEDMSRGAREDDGASVGWSISRSASTRHDTAGAISLLSRSLVLYTACCRPWIIRWSHVALKL